MNKQISLAKLPRSGGRGSNHFEIALLLSVLKMKKRYIADYQAGEHYSREKGIMLRRRGRMVGRRGEKKEGEKKNEEEKRGRRRGKGKKIKMEKCVNIGEERNGGTETVIC